MIVTDLDKTLLRSDSYISEYTIEVLKRCQAKGIKIVFATARSSQAAARILGQFMPDIFVGYGGALVLADEKVVHRSDILAEISNQLIRESLNTPEVLFIFASNELISFTSDVKALAEKDSSHYRYADFSKECNHRYLKISLNSASQDAVERIAANYPMLDMLRFTGEDLYRFANRDATKWSALMAIAKHYNIGTDTFVAFGDDINDLEMIANCGIGVAVENAIDEVKAVAKYVCDTNDSDGVAKWIAEHFIVTGV